LTYLGHDENTEDMDPQPEEVGGEEADEGQDVDESVDDRREAGMVVDFRLRLRVAAFVNDPELAAPSLLPDVALVLDVTDLGPRL
jgi:hypothetical protein